MGIKLGMATLAAALALSPAYSAPTATPTLDQFLSYPFVSGLVSAEHADRIAWVQNVNGVRNVWTAAGPGFAAKQVTRYTADDGQEITQIHFSEDGSQIVYVRGGDHDANWEAEGHLAPDPGSATEQPKVTIWAISAAGGEPRMIAEGDEPSISAKGQVAFTKDGQLWSTSLDGKTKAAKAFFDRGKDRKPLWSPDGSRIAFVSNRGDHAFIGVYTPGQPAIQWMAPSTGRDGDAVWSPDSKRIAFTRQPGSGGAPVPMLKQVPRPFAIWTADANSGEGAMAWTSPNTMDGSIPHSSDGVDLNWMAGDTLTFITLLDGWQHLYALPASGGTPKLLTPGKFMLEHVTPTRDKHALLYSADTGSTADDDDRRHAFRVALDGSAPVPLTSGTGLETAPVPAGASVAFVKADATHPFSVAMTDGRTVKPISPAVPYPSEALVVPKLVRFKAPDGTSVQGQLFERPGGATKKPGVIFVHGGPKRQMLLGWHYMDYYSNGYAVNQYLASRGFVVLSVNYRLGIGYGRAFEQAEHSGAQGAAEYQDVLAGAKVLQGMASVDPARIGIWGGSYGGYLTAMGLARNSDVFKAGADFHGVHDWSRSIAEQQEPAKRYEQGDRAEALKVAFQSSPVADVATWKSPVILIQGDDDRNVRFNQEEDMVGRLAALGVPHQELVIPDEIHGFLRHASWAKADKAATDFLIGQLKP